MKSKKHLNKAKCLIPLSASLLSTGLLGGTLGTTLAKTVTSLSSYNSRNADYLQDEEVQVGPLNVKYSLYKDGTCEIGKDNKTAISFIKDKTINMNTKLFQPKYVRDNFVYWAELFQDAYVDYKDEEGNIDEKLAPGATIKIPGTIKSNAEGTEKTYKLTKINQNSFENIRHKARLMLGFGTKDKIKYWFPHSSISHCYSWQLDFSDCYYLESIASHAFNNCTDISSLVFKNNVNLKEIGDEAFTNLSLGCPVFNPLAGFFYGDQWWNDAVLSAVEILSQDFVDYYDKYCAGFTSGEGLDKVFDKTPAKDITLDFSTSKLTNKNNTRSWITTGYSGMIGLLTGKTNEGGIDTTEATSNCWKYSNFLDAVNEANNELNKFEYFSHGSNKLYLENDTEYKPICTIKDVFLPKTMTSIPSIFGNYFNNNNGDFTKRDKQPIKTDKYSGLIWYGESNDYINYKEVRIPLTPTIERIDLQIADKSLYTDNENFFLGNFNDTDRTFLKHVKSFSVYSGDKSYFETAAERYWPSDVGPAPGTEDEQGNKGAEIIESCYTGAVDKIGSLNLEVITGQTIVDNRPWHFVTKKNNEEDTLEFTSFNIIPVRYNDNWTEVLDQSNITSTQTSLSGENWDYNHFIKVANLYYPGSYWFLIQLITTKNGIQFPIVSNQYIELKVNDDYIFNVIPNTIDIEIGKTGIAKKRFSAYYKNVDVTEQLEWSLVANESEKEITKSVFISEDGWISWTDKVAFKKDGYNLLVNAKTKETSTNLPALDKTISGFHINAINEESFTIYGGSKVLSGYNEIYGSDDKKWEIYCNGEPYVGEKSFTYSIEPDNYKIRISNDDPDKGLVYWENNVGVGTQKFNVVATADKGTYKEIRLVSPEITLNITHLPENILTTIGGSTSITTGIGKSGFDENKWDLYAYDTKIKPEYVTYSIEPEVPNISISNDGYVSWNDQIKSVSTYQFAVRCTVTGTEYSCISPTITMKFIDDKHNLVIDGGSVSLSGTAGSAGKDNHQWKLYDGGIQVQHGYTFTLNPYISGVSISNNGIISWSNKLKKGKYILKAQCEYDGRIVDSSNIELNIEEPESNGINNTLLISLLCVSGVALVAFATCIALLIINRKGNSKPKQEK